MSALKRSLSTALCLLQIWSIQAGDLSKAFKYLNLGDYDNAVKYFREVLQDDKENIAANYGMAKVFFAKDFKGTNLDSANRYMLRAIPVIHFNAEDKETKKLASLGVRTYTVGELQQLINEEGFKKASAENTVAAYEHFQKYFQQKELQDQAGLAIQKLVFEQAKTSGDISGIKSFLETYPQAVQHEAAQYLYDSLLYNATTADGRFESYKKYLELNPVGKFAALAKQNYEQKLFEHYAAKNTVNDYAVFEKQYPENPMLGAAQDSIYKLSTLGGSVVEYAAFIKQFPNNRNIFKAWEELYSEYTKLDVDTVYERFLKDYPAYSDKQKVYHDLELSKKEIIPFKLNDKYGYVLQPSGTPILENQYLEAATFHNGLAAVRVDECEDNCRYLYIDKAGRKPIVAIYNYAGNFEQGQAVVGIGNCERDSCLYGVINKRGTYIIPPIYSEIEELKEGYYLAAKEGQGIGFLKPDGTVAISLKYTNALPFCEGLAAVAIDSVWLFIDKTGKQPFVKSFKNVSSYTEGLCAVSEDGELWGYINALGDYVIEPAYVDAESFGGGIAIVTVKEKDKKNKNLFVMQRYKIDKTGKQIEKLEAPKEPAKNAGVKHKKKR